MLLSKDSSITWRDVYLILSSTMDPMLANTASLFQGMTKREPQSPITIAFERIDVNTPDYMLQSGIYLLTPSSSSKFCLILPSIDHLANTPGSLANTPLGSGTSTPSSLMSSGINTFLAEVSKRDPHCVISGSTTDLAACHIIPERFSRNENLLPQAVIDILRGLSNSFNNVQNGMHLNKKLQAAHDTYKIAVKFISGLGYFVLVMCNEEDLQKYHLRKLDCRWDVSNGPRTEFLDFHIQCCLAKNLHGGADLADEFYDCDDEDEVIVRLQEVSRKLSWKRMDVV